MKTYLKSIPLVTTLFFGLGYGLQSSALDTPAQMMANSSATTENRFIEMMRMHHESGVEMAQIALQKSQNSDVKKASQKIIDTQSKEMDQFAKWQKKWYSQLDTKSEIANMAMPMMDTSALKEKMGKDFDSEYLNMMVTHHEGAIQMAQDASAKLQHKEVKSLAEKIIKDQTSEITKLKQIEKSL